MNLLFSLRSGSVRRTDRSHLFQLFCHSAVFLYNSDFLNLAEALASQSLGVTMPESWAELSTGTITDNTTTEATAHQRAGPPGVNQPDKAEVSSEPGQTQQ